MFYHYFAGAVVAARKKQAEDQDEDHRNLNEHEYVLCFGAHPKPGEVYAVKKRYGQHGNQCLYKVGRWDVEHDLGDVFAANKCHARKRGCIRNKDDAINGKSNRGMITLCKNLVISPGYREPGADLGVRKSAA